MKRSDSRPGELYAGGRRALDRAWAADAEPVAYLNGHSDLIDELLAALQGAAGPPPGLLAVATGGYGRRRLCPFSDVDLLFVYDGSLDAVREEWIKQLLHGLWDCGLRVGQQVWSVQELELGEDIGGEFLLSLLDARPLAGDQTLLAALPIGLPGDGKGRGLALDSLLELTRRRHADFGGTLYHLEPDVKETPGGLRDIEVVEWLQALGDFELDNAQRLAIAEATDLLTGLRIDLHLMAGRNENRLSFARQEAVAMARGLPGRSRRERAEILMQRYFLNTRPVFRLARLGLAGARGRTVVSRPVPAEDAEVLKQVLGWLDGGVSTEGRLEGWQPPPQPPASEELRGALCRVLQPRPGLYEALSELYEVGFLERLLPEFVEVRARVIRDFYHRYTVDEHTLIAVREIERLLGPDCPDARFQTLLSETDGPELLVLALLLHDVGKGAEGRHAVRSAELAGPAMARFGFDPEDTALVAFLVRHHLAMSEIMLKRDVEDREVLHRFATETFDPERLRMLTLLTYADISAVGPGTLTAWKRDLLWQLYVGAHRQLTIEYGAERIAGRDLRRRLSGSLASGDNQDAFRHFLEGFPIRYLETTEGDEIYRHFRMAMRLEPGGIQSRLVQRSHHWELWVVTADQARLFARIAGLLSYFEMNIVRARGFGNRQGLILDSFHFEDPRGRFGSQPWEQERLLEQLGAVVQGELSIGELLERKEGSAVFPVSRQDFEPSVRFEEESGLGATIVEIVAPDAMGLLYRISQPMAELGCDVELALVSTAGETASDVFYLRHQGAKLSSDLQAELRERVLASLRESPG